MSVITLDVVRLSELVNSAAKFETDGSVAADIKELVEAFKAVDSALKQIKDSYKQLFIASGLVGKSISCDGVSIKVFESGSRFEIEDQELVAPEFLEVKLNTQEVSNYFEDEGKLPAGIAAKDRSYTVKIEAKHV